jgi:hypothetical protein
LAVGGERREATAPLALVGGVRAKSGRLTHLNDNIEKLSIMKPPDTGSCSAADVNAVLSKRYVDVLERHDLMTIAQSEKPGVLSGLFLPTVDDAYLQSRVRVMLIGQEPKKWGKDLHSLAAEGGLPAALHAYVDSQMAAYRKTASIPARKSRFRQFHFQLHASLRSQVSPQHNAVFWGNLLCMSRKSGSPRKALEIVRIAALSRDLLKVQFEVLQPQLVVFTTGSSYDGFLKEQIGHEYTTLAGFRPKHYWPFRANKLGIHAWRVRHPRRLTKEIRTHLFGAVNAASSLCLDRPAAEHFE